MYQLNDPRQRGTPLPSEDPEEPGLPDEFHAFQPPSISPETVFINGMGFRAIQRVTGVHHTTVITWVKKFGSSLPDTVPSDGIPHVAELDELETFVAKKKTKSGYGRQLTISRKA